MQFEKTFSIGSLRFGFDKELGSIEGTIWSCSIGFDITNEHYFVEIFRSPAIGAVKIDVIVNCEGHNILSIYDHLLSSGENRIVFPLSTITSRTFTGCVIVHYNSMSSPTSKTKAVTQTKNNISSIAEKIIPSLQLVNDLLNVLDNPDSFSDATLVCSTSEVHVHRVILSARSPVFAAMFKTQMQEGRDGVVDIVDMEPDVLNAMLRYMYSGQTDHLTDSLAGDLLYAADKYKLDELKLICVEKLKANMTANNVFHSVVLGDLHDAGLKMHAVEFICKYPQFSDLEKAEEWQSLMKNRPALALEVATTVINYVQKK